MIITIKGADFSSANIGTLSTYIISKSIGSGAAFDIPNFVDKNSSVNWVITLDEGYTFGTYSVTMGGDTITPSVVDNVMTISIAEVTGNVRIVVATVNENTGEDEPDEPVVPPVEPEEPETPTTGFVPLSSNWRLEKSAGKDNVRLICAENIPNNAVVNFKNASDWETYKYAISFDDGGRVGSTWIGGGYQTSAYTTTKEQVYTVMIARQDGEVFTTSDVEYIQNNMGYTL
jgi:hypothetical protein